jgi:hypothetical protein
MKKTAFIDIIAAGFIFLFAYTAINKLLNIISLRIVLKDYPLIGNFYQWFAWGLPILEFCIVALLLIRRTKIIGLYASLILMSLFTLYVTYLFIFAPHMPCTCGGMLQKLSWPGHLAFNLLSILLAAVAIILHKRSKTINNKITTPVLH